MKFINTKKRSVPLFFFFVIHSVLKRVSCLYYTAMRSEPETFEVLS